MRTAALALSLLLGASAFAKDLEVVVKGQEQDQPSIAKPLLDLPFDPYESVKASLKPDESRLTAASPLVSSWQGDRPFFLNSAHALRPWADGQVEEGAAFTLSLAREYQAWSDKPLPEKLLKVPWTLTIIDEDGRPFQRFKGDTLSRAPIHWEGRSDEGRWLDPGHDYSAIYVFSPGTPDAHTGYGEPLRFPSLVHRDKGRLIIALDSSILFGAKREESALDAGGEALLRAAADLIRLKAYGSAIEVRAYGVDLKSAARQAQAARDYLCGELFLSPAKTSLKTAAARPSQARLELLVTPKR